MESLPLAGLSIVVTRPREQAGQLQQLIEQLGGNAVLFPLLDISPPADTHALRNLIARLPGFDLAIFISPNAVRYGMAEIAAAGGVPSGLRIATVGQGSAKALRDAGIQDVIAPQGRSDSEALLVLPQLQNVRGWKVAIFRGDGGRELLGDTLKARGANVEYVACYQRSRTPQNIGVLLNSRADAITLSSSEALAHLWEMFDEAGKKQIADVTLFVPHARIAAAAEQQGWRKVVQTTSGDDGVVSGLVAWSKAKSCIGKHL
ncbi:MAG: uroporphyrinogen-III [Gallionellaceae bacterium]|nr:MAG: uroporphyrinogen-III [Gallionellaceae bacterium]